MSIRFDPYAFALAVVMHYFIVPWLIKHHWKPRPNLPSSIKAAANILLATGGIFMLVGVVCGVLFADLPRLWRFVWIAVASTGGALWIWNAFRLRDGVRSARWTSIPFLVASLPCLPVLAWFAAPVAAYCLFLDSNARRFFREQASNPSHPGNTVRATSLYLLEPHIRSMRIIRRVSLGGWIFLLHFFCVAIAILLPVLVPRPAASLTNGDHWNWEFLGISERLFFVLTFPVSLFMDQPKDAGLELFGYPASAMAFIPFFIVLALNSLLIGYTIQMLVSIIRSRAHPQLP